MKEIAIHPYGKTADYHYDFTAAEVGSCSQARFCAKAAKSHYEQNHPSEPIWNFLPRIQHHVQEGDPLDVVIYEAMRLSRFDVTIPRTLSRAQFAAAFQDRMQRAISWLRWNNNTGKRLKQLGINRELRHTAIQRLQAISVTSVNRIASSEFEVIMVKYEYLQLFNKLQLFFSMKGRYRTCSVFTSPVWQPKTYAKILLELHANPNESASVTDKNGNGNGNENEKRAFTKDENANGIEIAI